MNIEIDISKVIEEKDKLTDLTSRLKDLVKESSKETDELRECWISESSESFYNEYDKFKKDFNIFIEDNSKIINYLQEIVAGGYKDYDEKASNYIDENFSAF